MPAVAAASAPHAAAATPMATAVPASVVLPPMPPAGQAVAKNNEPKQTFSDEPFQIFVKTVNGKTITVNGKPSDTIEIIKSRIQQKDVFAQDAQRLTFASKQLEDGRILSDYNVRPDSTIFVTAGLLGGAPQLGR